MRFVESSIVIDRPALHVLSAFTQAHHLRNWWGVSRSSIELTKGGLYSLVWLSNDAMDYVLTGIISEYIPGCQLKIGSLVYFNSHKPILGPMELIVLATPEKIGTTLTIVQNGYRDGPDWDWYYRIVKETWPLVIVKIKTYLEKAVV